MLPSSFTVTVVYLHLPRRATGRAIWEHWQYNRHKQSCFGGVLRLDGRVNTIPARAIHEIRVTLAEEHEGARPPRALLRQHQNI
jgi:hypothetical protein